MSYFIYSCTYSIMEDCVALLLGSHTLYSMQHINRVMQLLYKLVVAFDWCEYMYEQWHHMHSQYSYMDTDMLRAT